MTEVATIQNGDFVGMARIVNSNTVHMDRKFTALDKNLKELGRCHNGYVKHMDRKTKVLGVGLLASAVGCYVLSKRVSKLEKKIDKLEEDKYVKDFMDAGDDCK